jgi:hypothetical protein
MEIMRVKDIHARVQESFSNVWYVVFYVIAMGALSFHLLHGFQSAFQTLGWMHRKYKPNSILLRYVVLRGNYTFRVCADADRIFYPEFIQIKENQEVRIKIQDIK